MHHACLLAEHNVKFSYNNLLGPPSAPVVKFEQNYLINSLVNSHLSWRRPFTFPDYPVTNYTVTLFNHSDGETITITRMANFSDYFQPLLSEGDDCYEIDVTVVATNSIGTSLPAIVNTGHPIGISI